MIASTMPTELLANLANALPSVGLHVRDAAGSVVELGSGHGVAFEPRGARSVARAPEGVELVEAVLPDGRQVTASFAAADREAVSPLLRATAGLHLDRDVPSAIRNVGYILDRVERTTMPTFIWPLRHVASGSARRGGSES